MGKVILPLDLSMATWRTNSSFNNGLAAGTTYDTLFPVQTGNRIVSSLIDVPAVPLHVNVASGFNVAACGFDADGLYLGNATGYQGCLTWGAGGRDVTPTSIKKIVFCLRRGSGSPALLPEDVAEAQLTVTYDYITGGKASAKTFLDAVGFSHFWNKLKGIFGVPEAPYKEVEWVESNGKQYVYLDWKPPIATWGFYADFLIRNAFITSSAGAWNASTNANGYGNVFGVRNASGVNDNGLGTYSSAGVLYIGNATNIATGIKTDKTRQTISLIGTTLTKPNGTTATVTRLSETANKPYWNMTVFAKHDGLRKSGNGSFLYPSSTRIYSLKFYDGTTVKVDLVGAIRKRDGVTGLYDKISKHFYPAPGMTYGNEVGDLGDKDTLVESTVNNIVQITVNNSTNRRLLRGNAPSLKKLVDGQKFSVIPMYTIAASTQTTELAGWDDTGNNSYVYLKLTLADGTETDWIPCYYNGYTRLTTHFGSGNAIFFTYRENEIYGAAPDSGGYHLARAFVADPSYYTYSNDSYNMYYSNPIAGAAGIKMYSLFMQLPDGRYASFTTTSGTGTTKTKNTAGFIPGKIYYRNGNTDIAENSNAGNATVNEAKYLIDLRYSGNQGSTLTDKKPVYLFGTIGSDGLFYLGDTWFTQTLPTSDDGKIYFYLGMAYDTYRIDKDANNPAYIYKNGALRLYGGYADSMPVATTSSPGAMSAADKTKLNGIETGAQVNIQSDWNQTTTTADDYIRNKPGNATTVAAGLMSADDKTKLNGIATGAEVNQNAFSNVKVGSTTVAADGKTDTLELVAGSNVTLTPDATNDKVTIAATDTTYSDATTSAHGLMSAADKTKLNGIETGAQVNIQPDWNQTTTTADDYIRNKPGIVGAGTSTTVGGLMSQADKTKLNGIATGAEVNVQSDWNQTTTTADDYIKNKPTVPDRLNVGTNQQGAATLGLKSGANGTVFGEVPISDIIGSVSPTKAFTNVKVGSATIAADLKEDTLELEAGTGISLSADTTNDKVTIGIGSFTRTSESLATKSVATATWTSLGTFTGEANTTYLILYGAAFASNATGYRQLHFAGSSSTVGRYAPSYSAVNGEQTRIEAAITYSFGSAGPITLWARQNSGSTLSVYGWYEAIKLPV